LQLNAPQREKQKSKKAKEDFLTWLFELEARATIQVPMPGHIHSSGSSS
jgi:hypothetical protein